MKNFSFLPLILGAALLISDLPVFAGDSVARGELQEPEKFIRWTDVRGGNHSDAPPPGSSNSEIEKPLEAPEPSSGSKTVPTRLMLERKEQNVDTIVQVLERNRNYLNKAQKELLDFYKDVDSFVFYEVKPANAGQSLSRGEKLVERFVRRDDEKDPGTTHTVFFVGNDEDTKSLEIIENKNQRKLVMKGSASFDLHKIKGDVYSAEGQKLAAQDVPKEKLEEMFGKEAAAKIKSAHVFRDKDGKPLAMRIIDKNGDVRISTVDEEKLQPSDEIEVPVPAKGSLSAALRLAFHPDYKLEYQDGGAVSLKRLEKV